MIITPTTAAELLRAEREGITLGEHFTAALALIFRVWLDDNEIDTLSLSEDLVVELIDHFADTDLTQYVINEENA